MIRSYKSEDLPTIMDIENRAWHENLPDADPLCFA